MRPNIDITHTLNGRVRDFASERGMSAEDAYRELIIFGLENYPAHEEDGEEDETTETPDDPELKAVVDGLDFSGSRELVEERRREAVRALAWLRDKGTWAQAGDVRFELHSDGVGKRVDYNEDSYWTELVRPAFKQAATDGLVEKGTRRYRWQQS